MSVSRRSIQSICDFADKIHAHESYEPTKSLVNKIPSKYRGHVGVFAVRESDAIKYIEKYKPTLLRHSVSSGKEFSHLPVPKINFGISKGLGFERVLIIPTKKYHEYLLGNSHVFDKDKTDEPKNKLYVAMTRAKYSLGFIIKNELINECDLPIWVYKKG